MSTPLVIWYHTIKVRDPYDPMKTTDIPNVKRPETPEEHILRGRIFQSIRKAVSLEFSCGIQDGDVRALMRQVIRTGEQGVSSQVFYWSEQISSSYKGQQKMRPWLSGLTKAASELEQLGEAIPTQTLRTVVMRSLKKDPRYKDVLRDIDINPDWHFATIIQHVEHAAHREDDLLATAKGGAGHQRPTRPEQSTRRPWTAPRTEEGGAPSPFQHRDAPYRGPYHRRGARVHSATEQHVPDNYDDYDEDPELDNDDYPVHVRSTRAHPPVGHSPTSPRPRAKGTSKKRTSG